MDARRHPRSLCRARAGEKLAAVGGTRLATLAPVFTRVRSRFLLAIAAIQAVPAVAFAHPGHGSSDSGTWAHYLGEPLHVAVIGATLAGLGLAKIALGDSAHRHHR